MSNHRSYFVFVLILLTQLAICQQNQDSSPDQIAINDSIQFKEREAVAIKEENWESLFQLYYASAKEAFGVRDYQVALPFYLKIDSISQKENFRSPTTVKSLIKRAEISRTAFTRESSDYAHLLLQEALEQAEEIGSQESIHITYVYLADTSGLKGEYEQAKQYIDEALAYFLANDREEYETYIARLYLIVISYYKLKKQYDKAEESLKKGIAYTRRKNNKLELAKLLYYYGNFQGGYTATCKEAMISFLESKSIYDSLNITDTYNYERLNRDLADCYYDNNNYQKAMEHYRIAYDLKSILAKKANRELSRRVETQFQTEKKEQEIALLNSEKKLIEQQKTNQRNLLLGGIGLSSIIGIFLFVQYRNRKKTNEKLRELDRLKSNFFANISHEFRTPLTLITAPVEQRLDSGKISQTDRQDFEMIQRNSRRLLTLVDQLLDLSKLEAGKYSLQLTEGDLGTHIRAIGESFMFTSKQQNISYEIQVDEIKGAWYDKDVIEKIMTNLLSNAMKYTDTSGSVLLKARRKNGKVNISVSNTASSLPFEALEKMFDRFYQADSHTEGAGIGLSLVKELVNVHRGVIKIESYSENTLQLELELPIDQTAFKSADFSQQVTQPPASPVSIPSKAPNTNEEPEELATEDDRDILLVVEDNSEVRQLLRNSLEKEYRFMEAANGREGIEMAVEWIPDLIISDIMMPEVDGLQLCNSLKTDERTSHIPVILLTARAGEEDQYKGLSTGADAYVTKPFQLKMLKTRITHLIASRRALRNRYSQEVILKPKDIAITNLDEVFLERVQTVLDSKLLESSFSTEEFSKAVGMSRMQLHRKLKALTGLSASEFIRSQRLKLAADLLRKSDANVSQIGYEVGFNDPSYFTKCFREAYGVSPTEYSKKSSS